MARERLDRQFIYTKPGQTFDVGVALHNVSHLVNLRPETEWQIDASYGQRFGHVPRGGKVEGILLRDPATIPNAEGQRLLTLGNENARAQAQYIGELSGDSKRFTIVTPQTLRADAVDGNNILIAPYLNNGKFEEFRKQEKLDGPQFEVSGMHHDVVSELKNKAVFHERVKAEQNPDFAVPHHDVVNVQEIGKAGKDLMDFQEELYTAIGMPDYQRGIFGRLDYSDGGFGSFNIKKNGQGEYVLETDDKKERKPYKSIDSALADAEEFMKEASGNNLDADVVLSRALDLKDVPGFSMHYMDGEALPLGFNGQILDKKTKACVGTTTYKTDDPDINTRRDEFEARIAKAGKAFVHGIAKEKGIDVKELRGFINVDVMIIGDQEREAQKRIIEGLQRGTFSNDLVKKLEKYGQLSEPVDFFFAESNPRRTNLIEAIDEIVLVDNLPQTIESMRGVMENGIRAEDKHPLPQDVDVEYLAEELGERYATDVRDSGLVMLRTRPLEAPKPGQNSTIGVIMTGDLAQRRSELHDVFNTVKRKAA